MGISYHLDEFFYIQKKEFFSLNPSKKRQSSSQGIFVGFVHALWHCTSQIQWYSEKGIFSWSSVGISLFQVLGWYPMYLIQGVHSALEPAEQKEVTE